MRTHKRIVWKPVRPLNVQLSKTPILLLPTRMSDNSAGGGTGCSKGAQCSYPVSSSEKLTEGTNSHGTEELPQKSELSRHSGGNLPELGNRATR